MRVCSLVLPLIAAAATLATGCTSVQDAARTRAANEMGCSYADVTLTPIGSGGYVADGCGQTMHLSCEGSSRRAPFCVTDDRPTPVEGTSSYEQGASGREHQGTADHTATGAVASAAKDAADVCGDVDGPRGPGEAIVTLAPDGRVAGVQLDPPYEGTPVGDCLGSQLARVRVRPFARWLVLKEDFVVGSTP
jgi:hypothetical protein